jgi:hypothetical protein
MAGKRNTPIEVEDETGQAGEPVVVYLGNRDAVERPEDPDDVDAAAAEGRAVNRLRIPHAGKLCTKVVVPAGVPLMQSAYDLTHVRGVWQAHSEADAPAWVASTDQALAQLLASHWGCELREVEQDHAASGDDAEED